MAIALRSGAKRADAPSLSRAPSVRTRLAMAMVAALTIVFFILPAAVGLIALLSD